MEHIHSWEFNIRYTGEEIFRPLHNSKENYLLFKLLLTTGPHHESDKAIPAPYTIFLNNYFNIILTDTTWFPK